MRDDTARYTQTPERQALVLDGRIRFAKHKWLIFPLDALING